MTAVLEKPNTFLANFELFEKLTPSTEPLALSRLRRNAIERFAALGFPGTRNEDWKFSNLTPLTKVPFKLAEASFERLNEIADRAKQGTLSLPDGIRLVFINGYYAHDLSSVSFFTGGVVVTSLADALTRHAELIEPHLAQYADYEDHPFNALNTAFINDGAFVHVPKGKVVEQPIHLVFISTSPEQATVSHPRNLIVAGSGTHLTLVESYLGLDEDVYFTNAVTEVAAGEGAVIDHYKVQRESKRAFHIHTLDVHQGRSSNFSSHLISLGGGLVRNEVRAVFDAEGCECTLNGLALASGRQHVDNHTVIDHAQPLCASHELYKHILDGQAHAVFNGKIFVRQDAQKTDAKQTNQTLLLSQDATINTKPQLEIYADDVKCTHGATVGQLEENAIFYLRSRGIGEAEARSLLTFAFANDIVRRIKVEAVRRELEHVLLASQGLPEL